MSLSEHAKLQRQVEDLVKNGLIMESFSPCVVLVLLTPKKVEHGGYSLIAKLQIRLL